MKKVEFKDYLDCVMRPLFLVLVVAAIAWLRPDLLSAEIKTPLTVASLFGIFVAFYMLEMFTNLAFKFLRPVDLLERLFMKKSTEEEGSE